MAHQYSALLHHDSIRLLKLLPASYDVNGSGLSCCLEDYRLSENPSYEALSYTWGPPVFPELLHTHNGILKITENLALALSRLRFNDRVRYLWVDAVCINQINAAEKSRQVAMMGSIYKSARRVICWLGQADESINDAMETLKRLAASASRFGITEVSLFCSLHAALPICFLRSSGISEWPIALPWMEAYHHLLRPYESPGRLVQGTRSNGQLQRLSQALQ